MSVSIIDAGFFIQFTFDGEVIIIQKNTIVLPTVDEPICTIFSHDLLHFLQRYKYEIDWNDVSTPAGMTSAQDVYDFIVRLMRGKTLTITITSADFTVNDILNVNVTALLKNKTDRTDFIVLTDDGSGTLIKQTSSYTFDSATGVITTDPGNYFILIF